MALKFAPGALVQSFGRFAGSRLPKISLCLPPLAHAIAKIQHPTVWHVIRGPLL